MTKKTPRAQVFHYFRYERRNNKTARVSGQNPNCSDCHTIIIELFFLKKTLQNYSFG